MFISTFVVISNYHGIESKKNIKYMYMYMYMSLLSGLAVQLTCLLTKNERGTQTQRWRRAAQLYM